jgi:hypothetical protein
MNVTALILPLLSTARMGCSLARPGVLMQEKQSVSTHPNPKDRNRSIIWARFAADSYEWVILSIRATRVAADAASQQLVSIAILGPGGKVLMESLIKTQEFSAREALEGHGIDYSVLLKALPYEEAVNEIKRIIDRKQVFCWDPFEIRKTLSAVAAANKENALALSLISVGEEYGRFLGRLRPGTSSYEIPELKGDSAADEGRSVLQAILEMAGSSQHLDGASASPMGWTGEFYRPKASPAEKLKGLLGLE